MSRSWRRKRRRFVRKVRRAFRSRAFVLATCLAIVAIFGAIFAYDAFQTKRQLNAAASQAQVLQSAIVSGDKGSAAAALTAFQQSAQAAHSHSDGPLWKLAGSIPFIGENFSSVTTIADALDNVSQHALPPLVAISTQLDLNNFSPKNGRIDLPALAELNTPVGIASRSLTINNELVAAIKPDRISTLFRAQVTDFQKKLQTATDAAKATADSLGLIPTMLGSKNRTYLLVFQNNAEIRSTGGIPGAYLLAKVNKGKIELSDQGTGSSLSGTKTGLKLTAEEKDLYSTRMTTYFQDATFTPDFPRSAHVMRAIVAASQHVNVDGVISIDPVAMSYLLRGTGPVTVPDGTVITEDNVVAQLLNKAYLRYATDFNKQDQFFEDTAATMFDVVTAGRGDSGTVVRGLVRAAKERRLLIWSAHSDEQQRLETMPVSATLVPDSDLQPTLGVFFNDSVGSKLQYYLRYHTTVTSEKCEGYGRQTIGVNVSLRSTVPANAASLPFAINGYSTGNNPGVMLMNLRFYLPTGGILKAASLDAVPLLKTTRTHDGHRVATVPVRLKPGQASTVNLTFETTPDQRNTIQVRSTPGAQPGSNVTVLPTACG